MLKSIVASIELFKEENQMKKLLSMILLFAMPVSLIACSRFGPIETETTPVTTVYDENYSGSLKSETTPVITVYDENLPNADGVLRVDGVILSNAHGNEIFREPRPLNHVFRVNSATVDKFSHSFLVIEDYDTLNRKFSEFEIQDNVDMNSIFDVDLFKKNIIIVASEKNFKDNTTFCWFDCKFTDETNMLTITPVRKQFLSSLIYYTSELFLITVPRDFFPANYDFKKLECTVEDSVKLDDSSMPDPWKAGGKITVAILIKCKDGEYYSQVCSKYTDDQLNVDIEKVHEEMRKNNAEYAQKIDLKCPNVFYSGVSNYIYVNFANKSEFLIYKEYFDLLTSSEYVEKVIIT